MRFRIRSCDLDLLEQAIERVGGRQKPCSHRVLVKEGESGLSERHDQ